MTVAVDIGGTKIAAARIEGARVLERRSAPSPMHGDYARIPQVVAELCGDWLEHDRRMGIASAGLIERDRIVLVSREGRPSLALGAAIEQQFGLTPVILNDAWAGALGEYTHGQHPPCETFAYVTVSTGIGAGFVHKGQLLTSGNGLMAHLGHSSVSPGNGAAILCACGRTGCLETFASGTAVERLGSALLGAPHTAAELCVLAHSHSQVAALLDRAAAALVEGLLNARAMLGVDCAVVGGSLGRAPAFFSRLEQHMAGIAAPWRLPLFPARLSADAELFGAALAAESSIHP